MNGLGYRCPAWHAFHTFFKAVPLTHSSRCLRSESFGTFSIRAVSPRSQIPRVIVGWFLGSPPHTLHLIREDGQPVAAIQWAACAYPRSPQGMDRLECADLRTAAKPHCQQRALHHTGSHQTPESRQRRMPPALSGAASRGIRRRPPTTIPLDVHTSIVRVTGAGLKSMRPAVLSAHFRHAHPCFAPHPVCRTCAPGARR